MLVSVGVCFFTQHRLAQAEYLSMHFFRLLVFALMAQHCR